MANISSTCIWSGIDPLLLPWTNNPISIQGSGATYGIAMTVGDPVQFFSPKPALNSNNTFFAELSQCGDKTNYSCVALNGGVYTPPTDVNVTMDPIAWNGTPGVDVVVGDSYQEKLYNDKLQIANHVIPGFPFFTYEQTYDLPTLPSGLALGINSSFLQAMLNLYIVGTKAWSLWPGNSYYGYDGLLVLGGYDKGRAGTTFTSYETGWRTGYGTPIPMHLAVKGLDWEFSPGNSTSIFPDDITILDVSLEPFFDYMHLPSESMQRLYTAYNATYNSTIDDYMFQDYSYNTTLIVTLEDGSETRIPATDLFDLPTYYNDRGYLDYTTYDYYTAKLREYYVGGGGVLFFGQPFLNQKLIVADYDAGKFHMADAVKQDFGPGARDLQPLCAGGTPVPDGVVINKNDTAPPTTGHKSKTNVAAIAGGVGGGVGGLLIIAAIIFFLVRRKKKQNQEDVPYLSEVTHASEAPYRGSTMSPPPKYMKAGVYETVNPEISESQRFSPPPPQTIRLTPGVSALGTPRSDGARLSSLGGSGSDNPRSVTGVSSTGRGSQYEMSSENKFLATSGPIEMPNEYGYEDHIDGRRYDH